MGKGALGDSTNFAVYVIHLPNSTPDTAFTSTLHDKLLNSPLVNQRVCLSRNLRANRCQKSRVNRRFNHRYVHCLNPRVSPHRFPIAIAVASTIHTTHVTAMNFPYQAAFTSTDISAIDPTIVYPVRAAVTTTISTAFVTANVTAPPSSLTSYIYRRFGLLFLSLPRSLMLSCSHVRVHVWTRLTLFFYATFVC